AQKRPNCVCERTSLERNQLAQALLFLLLAGTGALVGRAALIALAGLGAAAIGTLRGRVSIALRLGLWGIWLVVCCSGGWVRGSGRDRVSCGRCGSGSRCGRSFAGITGADGLHLGDACVTGSGLVGS